VNALDPKNCTRCRASIPADSEERPISLGSHVYAPVMPRPVMPGGIRPDGTVVEPAEVWWEIEADYEKRGPIAALLCTTCARELQDWLYRYEPATAAV
jgi:hypothetical protein